MLLKSEEKGEVNFFHYSSTLSQGRTAFAPRFYEIKERDLTLCACQLKGRQF